MKRVLLFIAIVLFGTAAICQNPMLLRDVYPGVTGSGIQQIVKTDNYTFFNAEDDDADADRGLYRTDGTSGGTIKLNLSYPTYNSTKAEKLTALGDKIIFAGDNFSNYGEIWASDGTQGGTIAIERFQPTATGVVPVKELIAMGPNVFYSIVDGNNHAVLKKTDGTSGGTSVVYEFSAFSGIPSVGLLTPVNNVLYFIVYDAGGTGEDQLWRSDGTTAGTNMVFNFTTARFVEGYIMPFGNDLYIMIGSVAGGIRTNTLWKSDGTTIGTGPLKAIGTGTTNNYPPFAVIGNTMYFAGVDGNGKELWKTDGTAAGTIMVADINSGAASSNPTALTVLNNDLFYAATTVNEGIELWKFDGVNASLVKDINPGAANSTPGSLVLSNNTIVFRATTVANGSELWISDGTSANTLPIANINPGAANAVPNILTPGNPVYFSANNGVLGAEIFKYDNSQGIAGLHKLYVNDNSTAGDVFTTAIGSNSNQGTKSAPVATITYALSLAEAGDTIVVDAGTFAEQVFINKGITIRGAGAGVTIIERPATNLVSTPNIPRTGVIYTAPDISELFINKLTIKSAATPASTNIGFAIVSQTGGAISDCEIIGGYLGDGLFFTNSGTNSINIGVTNNNLHHIFFMSVNFQGPKISAVVNNNTIDVTGSAFGMGVLGGGEPELIDGFIVTGNTIKGYNGFGVKVTSNYPGVVVSNNSFQDVVSWGPVTAIQNNGVDQINATCNWFGTTDAEIIKPKIVGNVNYGPWLVNGADTDPVALGFQPAAGTCTGRQNKFYVNDNATAGDLFTKAVGNNTGNGFSTAPFATITYALSVAQAGDTIVVDAGTFVEQVNINKAITIKGAGKALTYIQGPPAPITSLPDFGEIGIIQSLSGIGEVIIKELSIDGTNSNEQHSILIQGAGQVIDCEMQHVNNGVYFRDPGTVPHTAIASGNHIHDFSYVGLMFAGSQLNGQALNNTIDLTGALFGMGFIIGGDLGPVPQFTATNNEVKNYNGFGFSVNSLNTVIGNNSIKGLNNSAILNGSGNTITATCNWFGAADATTVLGSISGGVTYTPWLTNGTDNDVAIGFQPVADACNGKQNKFYVNDNSQSGDVFTTAIGSNNNNGLPSKPFASAVYAYGIAQAGDTIYVDAGMYDLGGMTYSFTKPMTILGTNFQVSPNDPSDKLLPNAGRNEESIVTNGIFTIAASGLSFKGFTFNMGDHRAFELQNGVGTNNDFGQFLFSKNILKINTVGNFNQFPITGKLVTSPAMPVTAGFTFSDNRFEKSGSASGTTFNFNYVKNVTVTDNSFVVTGTTFRSQTTLNLGNTGLVDSVVFANNIVDKAATVVGGSRLAIASITGNKIYNSNNAISMTNSIPEPSAIEFSNNLLDGSSGILPFILYTRANGATAGASSSFKAENNTINVVAVPNAATLLGSFNITFNNSVLNPTLIIRGNKLNYGGDLSSIQGQFLRPIVIKGNLAIATVDNNEITLAGTNLQPKNPVNVLPVCPAISLYTDNTTTSFIPAGAVINIVNNKVHGFKQSVVIFDPISSGGKDEYTGYGNLGANITVNIHNNSFTNDSISINNGAVSQEVNATCNWYGITAVQDLVKKVTKETGAYLPWLTNGTDTDPATGFQPAGNACNGSFPMVVLDASTNVTCNGANNGTINITVTGGLAPYTFAWTKDEDALFSSSIEDLTGLAPGTYHLNITDTWGTNVLFDMNGVIITFDVTITEPDVLTAVATGTNNICFGASAGAASVAPVGGTLPYTYLWTNGETTEEISDLSAGIYGVTVTDANGCTVISTYEVTQPTQVTALITGVSTACSNSASVAVIGGTGAYTYLWSNGAVTPAVTSLAAGTYSVMVTDANGCTGLASIVLTASEAFNPAAQVTDVSCFGSSNGSITVTNVNGTAPFQYSIDGINYQLSNVFNNLAFGTYTVTVVDANGCTGFITKTITQPPLLTLTNNNVQSTCFGFSTGSITVIANGGSGGYSYAWTGPGLFTSSQRNISNLAAGNYLLTVTDNNGCTQILNATVPTFNAIVATEIVTNIACKGAANGAINLTVIGGSGSGFAFSWSNNATTEDIANLGTGNYSVTITDIGSGCALNKSFTITQPAGIVGLATAKTNATGCNSLGTITATGSGGTAPYQYKLDNGTYQASGAFLNLYGGSYTVWVKDVNGCTLSKVVAITDNGSDQYESNNTRSKASLVNIGNVISARIALATDPADCFKFGTPSGGGTFTISLTHPSVSFTYNLYLTASSTSPMVPTSTSATTKVYTLAGGTTYFIVVTGGLSYTCYNLSINASAPALSRIGSNAQTESVKITNLPPESLSSMAYPNPHSGAFNLRIASPEAGRAKIELFNISGQKLMEKSANLLKTENNIVPFKGIRQGTIFYRVQIGKHIATGKIIGTN